MTKYKRYYEKSYDELYYIFDSITLPEEEFEEKVEYDGYSVFADSLTPHEVLDLLNEHARLKSRYKVLHTQFQDLKKFLENNLNEYWTREKLNEKIIKLSDENEQLKKEILHKKNKELKKEKKELCKYECKVKAFEEINELFKNGLIGEEHNDD